MCRLKFTIEEEIPAPVYVYYQLDNFYQNHRRYVKSRSNTQLMGKWEKKGSKELDMCDPVTTNADLDKH